MDTWRPQKLNVTEMYGISAVMQIIGFDIQCRYYHFNLPTDKETEARKSRDFPSSTLFIYFWWYQVLAVACRLFIVAYRLLSSCGMLGSVVAAHWFYCSQHVGS